MTPGFSVHTTARFDRELRKLNRHHPDLAALYQRACSILATDPYNQSREHPIKKLEGGKPGQGQYRVRLGRIRFRYDIEGQVVYLKACSLRREETYR
ncbi:MAG: hypothetical protein HY650_07705 [Acidobacteria bacterium]|nr:hypothetical protein [Acidobacteriota bacterium]